MNKLHILNGSSKGRSFPLNADEFSIGRSPGNDIQIEGVSVSRKHAQLIKKQDKYFIKDLNSKNGIYIDGNKMNPGERCEVTEGELISIGLIAIAIIKDELETESSLAETAAVPEGVSAKELSILDEMDFSDLSDDIEEIDPQDRPMSSKKNLELIYKVSRILMTTMQSTASVNNILGEILHFVLDLLTRIDRGAFILIDEETGEITKIIPITKKNGLKKQKMFSQTIVDRVLRKRKPVIMYDTLDEKETDLSESMVAMSIRSVMCIPMISNAKIRGVIYVDSLKRPYGFRSEDLALLNALSTAAAFAIEKSPL